MFPQLAQELLLADEAVDNNHIFFVFFFSLLVHVGSALVELSKRRSILTHP